MLQCLTGANGSSRSEHYRREVSRWHGLSSNANLAKEAAFSLSCPCGKVLSPSLLGIGEVVKGEASSGQGAGRRLGGGLAPLGLFLCQVKYLSAWSDELLGRGRCPNSMILWMVDAGFRRSAGVTDLSPSLG